MFDKFLKLDFGTKPTTLSYTEVSVVIDPELILKGWAEAYAKDMHRRNPLKFEAIQPQTIQDGVTTEELLYEYFSQLLRYRIESLSKKARYWREMKQLAMPAWIQFVISQIGIVFDRARGLKFIPKMDGKDELDIRAMIEVSNVIKAFDSDGKPSFTAAFPPSEEGNLEVMSMAIVNSFVCGNTPNTQPIFSYVVGFLGMKLVESSTEALMMYRVRYDDVSFIRGMLTAEATVLE